MDKYPFTHKGKVLLMGCAAAALLLLSIVVVFAQGPQPRAPQSVPLGSGFTYQGELKSAGAPVNGPCQLAFRLFDDPAAGNQIGLPITQTVPITAGLFTVVLDAADEFGPNAFNGDGRWLEIAVSTPCPAGSFTTLAPRQPVTPAPYALSALKTDYKNVLVVAKSGGHYHTIGDALASIANNSATNHYLIWVAPGTYTETITMKPYVDIEGAGELATTVTYSGAGSNNTGTVVGASNAELRWLSVENTGGNTYAVAVYNNNGASPRLTHVTARASGGTNSNYGVANNASSDPTMTNVTASTTGGTYNYGVDNSASSPTMTNVAASASGGTNANFGVLNLTSSSPAMMNVTASASGGAYDYGVYNVASSAPTMTNVTASALGGPYDNYGVYNDSSSPTMMNVTASASGGANENYGMYNIASSPTMMNVTASASGGTSSYGVYNDSSSPAMMNVTASASGGTSSYGVYNAGASLAMMNVTASASGGTDNYGVYNNVSSPTIDHSTISASGGSNGYGIANSAGSGSYTVKVNNSQVNGSTNSINNDSHFNTLVGASQLVGAAVTTGGTLKCIFSYDASYGALSATCQ